MNTKLNVWIVCLILFVTISNGQIPSFGGCPDYQPMLGFNKEKFLGKWYEAERYFTVTELGSRCVSVTYERRPDGKIWVNNEITNRLTGVQRIISGTMKLTGKSDEAKYQVQYTSFPVNYDTSLMVLDTDYKSFAIVWSCSGVGPIGHTESAWVLTRERLAPGPVLQRSYGVLDKYKISRRFFIKTDQTNCVTVAPAVEVVDSTSTTEQIEYPDAEENVGEENSVVGEQQ